MSRNNSGKNNPFYGRHHTQKTKDKLRRINLGKHHSEATKQKMSDVKREKKRPEFRGENHPFYGKKRPEHGMKLKGKPRPDMIGKKYPKQQEWMRNGGSSYAQSFIKSPSKPQVQLFEQIKILYPFAILNYPFLNYSIDIAIPKLKIAIEYDGSFWHQDSLSDNQRQSKLEKFGWKFLRYRDTIPTIEKLGNDLDEKRHPTTPIQIYSWF